LSWIISPVYGGMKCVQQTEYIKSALNRQTTQQKMEAPRGAELNLPGGEDNN